LNINILLTGGRAPVTLELARLLSKAGYNIFVADSVKYYLSKYSKAVIKSFVIPSPRFNYSGFIDALIIIIKQEKINLLIPTCEEIFYIGNALDQLTSLCTVFCESLDKLNLLHNKWEFIKKVEKLGLVTPKTWLIKSQKDLSNLLETIKNIKVILKPVYSRFASNIFILDQSIKAMPILEINPQKPWLIQEFITGKHYCSYSIAHQGKLTAHGVYPTIYTAGKGACLYFELIDHPKILNWVKTFVMAENFTGQIAFDFIESAEGILYPLECNPRAISAIHLFQVSDGLEKAFFNKTEGIIQPKTSQRAMLGLAMIIYSFFPAIKSYNLRDWFRKFINSKDVIFKLDDPLPFFYLGVIMFQFTICSLTDNITLQEASTIDIEWNGEII
jgi:predicted ATP-grasp superfamily ATP-dependent carboligase